MFGLLFWLSPVTTTDSRAAKLALASDKHHDDTQFSFDHSLCSGESSASLCDTWSERIQSAMSDLALTEP